MYTSILVLVFVGYLQLCLFESRRGRRLVLSIARGWMDLVVASMVSRIERTLRYVTRYIITLSWYYSLHAFLRLLLQSIAGIYQVIEAIFLRNRDRTRKLRRERRSGLSHLEQIAEHKADTKLSLKEAVKRKDKALRG